MTTPPRHLHAVPSPGPRVYTAEFKAAAVARVDAGEPVAAIARALGVARNTLKSWIRQTLEEPRADPASVGSGIVEAAASGDRRATLVALRTEIAGRIVSVTNRDLPAHARLLTDTIREIEMLDHEARSRAEDEDAGVLEDEPIGPEDF